MAKIVAEQVLTDTTTWRETQPWEENCEATVEHDRVLWYCTRPKGHKGKVHAAHYEEHEAPYDSVVGVAWVEEEGE